MDELVKTTEKKNKPRTESTIQNPTTYSSVYIRIQPFFTPISLEPAAASSSGAPTAPTRQLQFLLVLVDPTNSIQHTTVTQAVPEKWLEMWEAHEWVEDLVVEALRVGVEVVGQGYVVDRMGWEDLGKSKLKKRGFARPAATEPPPELSEKSQ